jgi:hypothetical protein
VNLIALPIITPKRGAPDHRATPGQVARHVGQESMCARARTASRLAVVLTSFAKSNETPEVEMLGPIWNSPDVVQMERAP